MLSPLVSLALTLLVAAYARATPTDENLVARQGIGATTATLMARQAKMFSGQGTFWDPALGSCVSS